MQLPGDVCDHAVAIRSLNHFIDPANALAVLARVLKRGETLTLVRSLALPLASQPAAKANSGAAVG